MTEPSSSLSDFRMYPCGPPRREVRLFYLRLMGVSKAEAVSPLKDKVQT